jgi:uncharacterized membrane protein
VRNAIKWSNSYRIASYAKGSLWIIPFFAIALELIVARFISGLDQRLGWTLLGLGVSGANALYQTIVTMTMSFTVFTFGSLIVAIQVASGQLTPRVIATTLLRDNTVRYTVGLFVFTMLYALRALNRTGESVEQFSAFTVGLLGLASLVMFLYLIDYAARLLRPASIVWRVGESAIAVLESVYPHKYGESGAASAPAIDLGTPVCVVLHEGSSGTVLAVNAGALIDEAKASGALIEFVPGVGDFVAVGEPLFRLYRATLTVSDDELRSCVAVGPERTMEQDPTFGFRILVDIALKGLSKAINDPTTAVLAIDQIHRVLRVAGIRRLQDDSIVDANGRVLVIARTPKWEDYVHLACREIRLHAGENIQIARRLRAMIENLMATLPAVRHKALREELDLLDRTIEAVFRLPEDLALARIADPQGLGGIMVPPPGERGRPAMLVAAVSQAAAVESDTVRA